MKNFITHINKAQKYLDNLNIPYSKNVTYSVAELKAEWGLCTKKGQSYKIEINKMLLQNESSDKGLEQTIIHELLHSCPKCMEHTGQWKIYAQQITKLGVYNIQRCNDYKDVGISEEERQKELNNAKYLFKCKNCGEMIPYYRKPKWIDRPERVKCGKCNILNTIVRIK